MKAITAEAARPSRRSFVSALAAMSAVFATRTVTAEPPSAITAQHAAVFNELAAYEQALIIRLAWAMPRSDGRDRKGDAPRELFTDAQWAAYERRERLRGAR
jgi:hypothetical protein